MPHINGIKKHLATHREAKVIIDEDTWFENTYSMGPENSLRATTNGRDIRFICKYGQLRMFENEEEWTFCKHIKESEAAEPAMTFGKLREVMEPEKMNITIEELEE